MRIGIVCKGQTTSRCGFEAIKMRDSCIGEIYKVTVAEGGGKRRFLRRIGKCAAMLLENGVSMCAVGDGIPELSRFGITAVECGDRILRERAGAAALMFAREHCPNADFAITGGGFSEVVSAAVEILRVRRNVVIENHAYDEIAEELYERLGVSICGSKTENMIELSPCNGERFLSFGEISASMSDFGVTIPGFDMTEIPECVAAQFATVLQISGVLRKNDINVEYFPK